MIRILCLTLSLLLLAGCTRPASYTDETLQVYDANTKYRIDAADDGFNIIVQYYRYQFWPESSAVATACRSVLTAIAYEHAESIGKEIEYINEQRIRISMGRNGFSGMTSCSATTPVKFKS